MLKRVTKGLLALVFACALQPAQADTGPSIITSNVVQINEYTSPEGFKHPGIRFTKESLENLRAQVIAGREPWTSYFEGMRRRHWAQFTYRSGNDNGSGLPRNPIIDNNGKVATFIDDAQAALMHSVLYYVTGDERYRTVAMRILNIYSHMSPTGVNYFPDVHIKMGQPIYHMTAAAEILRTTSAMTPSLQWTQEMTDNYINNFLTPQRNAYIRKNHYFMNQFSYALIGNTAASIFSDDIAGYQEAVEWATVNATAENQGWNGSIKRVFRWMTQNDATGEPLETPRVQLAEMGRDQPHAIGNVDSLFIISQIISSQGTKVDPVSGTVSIASDAIDPVHFNDDALLKGYIEFIKYNFGEDIEWTPMAISILPDGTFDSIYRRVNQQQRGRLSANAYAALYHYFQHNAGYDLTSGENRFVSLVYEKNKLAYSDGIRSGGYWGPREHVYDSEFWLHLPPTAADNSVPPRGEPREILDPLPPAGPAGITDFETRYYVIDGQGQTETDGDITYVSVTATPTEPTNFTLWYFYPSDGRNGLRIRSNGPARIEFTRGASLPATSTVHVPDTGGQWQYVAFDRTKQDVGGSGDITFFRLVSERSVPTTVDFDHIKTDSGGVLAPLFANGSPVASMDATTYVGGTLGRSFAATTAAGTTLSYRGENLPQGAQLDASSGAFSWSPANGQQGSYRFHVIAGDGTYQSSHEVVIDVLADVQAAVTIAEARVPGVEYESATLNAFDAAHDAAVSAIERGASAAEIDVALAQLAVAANGLRELSAQISEEIANDELGPEAEGVRLNYPAFVATSNTWLGALVDGNAGNFNSRWGDHMVLLDFGAKYRVIPTALHIQTRQGFPDRVRGGHMLASDDNINWTVITDKSGYGEQMQRLPVYPEYRDRAYRYLKIYAAPADCMCPVFDLGELYLFGYRKEVNEIVTAPPRWLVGETLSLQFKTTDPQGNPVALTAELPQGAQFDAATGLLTWTPSASQTGPQALTVTADYGYTIDVTALTIKVSSNANAAIDEILTELGPTDSYTEFSVGTLNRAVADARAVAGNADFGVLRKLDYVSLVEKAVALLKPYFGKMDILGNATVLASHQQWNTPSVGPTLSGRPAFDGNVATFVDLQNGNGTWVRADFGEGRHVQVSEVRLTPRVNNALRLNGAWITASNDGATWTTLATLPSNAYPNNTTYTPSILIVSDTNTYRYLRFNGANGSFGNVSEIDYIGVTNFGFDDTTLQYLISKAESFEQAEYTEASWLAMSEVLTSAKSVAASVPLNPDAVSEATENLDAALNDLVPLKGSVRIYAEQVGNEAGGTVTFKVTRSGGSFGKASVQYQTADGSAKAGEDYQTLAALLTWADGEQGEKPVAVALISDAFYEDTEQFMAALSDPYGAELGSPSSTSITIADDDVNALPGLSVANASMAEGSWLSAVLGQNRIKFNITLSGKPKKRVSAVLTTADGTAKAVLDYIPYIGVVSFAPGETSKTIEVLIVPDRVKEADETMKLKAQGIVNAKSQQPTGTGTIVNDD